jgi:hypothetical protein
MHSKDSGIETFSVYVVMVHLFPAWFGVFGLITKQTNELRGAGLLVILFIRNEYERLKFVDLSGPFVFLLQHSLQLFYSLEKSVPQRWKQKKHPQYQS